MRYMLPLLLFLIPAGNSFAQIRDTAAMFKCATGEEMPEFPGGQDRMIAYLAENIYYPETASNGGVDGKVVLRFIVDEEGCISHLQVVRSNNSSIDAEVINAISRMPCWEPGKRNGVPVKTIFFLPVTICLR